MSWTRFAAKNAERIALLAMSAMMLALVGDVVYRYAFNSSIRGVPELSANYLLPAVIFMSMASTTEAGQHVRVGILFERFSRRQRGWVDRASHAIAFLIWLGIACMAGARAWASYLAGEVPVAGVSLPYYVSYGLVAAGSIVMLLVTAALVIVGPGSRGTSETGQEGDDVASA